MCRVAARMALLGLTVVLAGCGWARPPYAHDPLLRNRGAVAGDPAQACNPVDLPAQEPTPPRAPAPDRLPTLEWEQAPAGQHSLPTTSPPVG